MKKFKCTLEGIYCDGRDFSRITNDPIQIPNLLKEIDEVNNTRFKKMMNNKTELPHIISEFKSELFKYVRFLVIEYRMKFIKTDDEVIDNGMLIIEINIKFDKKYYDYIKEVNRTFEVRFAKVGCELQYDYDTRSDEEPIYITCPSYMSDIKFD